MSKQSRSEQMDFKGLEIIADEFTGVASSVSPSAATTAMKNKTEIAALVSPTVDYANLTAATAAIKSIIDALKA